MKAVCTYLRSRLSEEGRMVSRFVATLPYSLAAALVRVALRLLLLFLP